MNEVISTSLESILLNKGIDMPVNPTIADVVMWLYKKHEIWIEVSYKRNGNASNHFFNYKITLINTDLFNEKVTECFWFKTPTEAYESAIHYYLNNLI